MQEEGGHYCSTSNKMVTGVSASSSAHHAHLHKIAKEMDMVFLEFNLFSETRFIEHAHRTFDHFARMFRILYEKLKRDEENPSRAKITIQKVLDYRIF